MPDFLIEIACYSPHSAMIAENAGANRIELCDNPSEGGTTPSYGVLKVVREKVSIPVFPIIRPRGGHFVYAIEEIEIMKADIQLCKQLGFEGVVIGLLDENGKVAYDETARLTEMAWPLDVTFHRAFDRTIEPFEAMETIIRAGCTRILTSGQVPDVNKNPALIAGLISAAIHRIIIMPGSGVRSDNIAALALVTGAKEFHSSARINVPEPFFTPVSMEEHFEQTLADPAEVAAMLIALGEVPAVQ
jgi:copper homeostasis protein